jgi:hypothetical protein
MPGTDGELAAGFEPFHLAAEGVFGVPGQARIEILAWGRGIGAVESIGRRLCRGRRFAEFAAEH